MTTTHREKRRSFTSRSPVGAPRRSSRILYEASPLQGSHVPPESPIVDPDDNDPTEGFSTVYGASASSQAGFSEAEYEEEDRFVSARGGDETEMEGRRLHMGLAGYRRSSGEKDEIKKEKLSAGGSSVSLAIGNETPVFERRVSPPLTGKTSRKSQLLHPIPAFCTLLPIRIGGRYSCQPRTNSKPFPRGRSITRKTCEDAILLGAVAWGIYKLGHAWDEKALAGEIGLLVGLSIIYTTFRARRVSTPDPTSHLRPGSPALSSTTLHGVGGGHLRERSARGSATNLGAISATREKSGTTLTSPEGNPGVEIGGRGCVWGTEEREYRECLDDGALFALLLSPLIASAMLHVALNQLSATPPMATNLGWAIEQPLVLSSTPIRVPKGVSIPFIANDSIKALSALATSRRNLVQLFTLCSFVLLVQLSWSLRLTIKLSKKNPTPPSSTSMERENSDPSRLAHVTTTFWLRKGELKRNLSSVLMGFLVTGGCILVKIATAHIDHGVWSDMPPSDIIIATLFYQFSLYVCVRLARRGFTLGELAVVCNAATALFMETVNMTRMKIQILRTPYIKTYRLPTPLLTFQLALIPGSLLAGILLSPLLYLSRHLAQKPAHRLRFPHEKPVHRRLLAMGFYGGSAIVCVGLVGTWARWCLNWRDPWLWVVCWLFDGRKPWTRPALISYWGALAAVSVAGWSRQLSRGRRHRRYVVPGQAAQRDSKEQRQASYSNVSTNGPGVGNDGISGVATQMMDAADSRMPTLSVNARRKFFHALAVVMFVPGIAVDPAFTHLSFSVAFAAFNFAEYVRYFALWPFGVSVHLFLNEFLDHKDSGTAILSHFYLLAGCASPLWLEGPSEILHYTGILSLGIGDALASIVGRRYGRIRWSQSSGKTVEGSIAFFLSVMAASGLLWLFGLVEEFNPWTYGLTVFLSTLLEAFSAQNDNLILPMYAWALGTLLGV